jgi:hypothetical protein
MSPPASLLFPTRRRREYLAVALASVAPQAADGGRDGKTVQLRPIFALYLAGQLPLGEILVPRNGSVAAGRG